VVDLKVFEHFASEIDDDYKVLLAGPIQFRLNHNFIANRLILDLWDYPSR
jgi:hypothetical protein